MSNVTEINSREPLDERQLDEYLSGGSTYSRAYRNVDSDDVPHGLDKLVFAEAQAAVIRRKGMNWQRIAPTLAIAATAVLTVSIVMRSGLDTPRKQEQAIRSEIAELRKKEELQTTADAAVSAEVTREVAAASIPERKAKVVTRQEAPTIVAEVAAPAPAAAPPAARDRFSADKKLEKDSGFVANSRADANAPGVALKDEVVVTGSLLRQNPQEAAVAVGVISQEELAKSKARPNQDLQAIQAIQSGDSRRTTLPTQPDNRATDLSEIIVTAQQRTITMTGAGPHGTIAIETQSSADRRMERESRESNPAYWLSYIRDLRADNKSSAADREWNRFVKAYPNYEVAAGDRARPKK